MLLIGCGHTLCRACALRLFSASALLCPECKSVSSVHDINELPKNMALLAMANQCHIYDAAATSSVVAAARPADVPLCPEHRKEIEAFCEEDDLLVCIDCILLSSHKGHAIGPIPQSSQKRRTEMAKACVAADKLGEALGSLLASATSFRMETSATAGNRKEQINRIYEDIVGAALERKKLLHQEIDLALSKQQEWVDQKIASIKKQLDSISSLKHEVQLMSNENDIAFLEKSRPRKALAAEATVSVPRLNLTPIFPEISREKEVAALCRAFAHLQAANKSSSSSGLRSPKKAVSPKSGLGPTHYHAHKGAKVGSTNKLTKRKACVLSPSNEQRTNMMPSFPQFPTQKNVRLNSATVARLQTQSITSKDISAKPIVFTDEYPIWSHNCDRENLRETIGKAGSRLPNATLPSMKEKIEEKQTERKGAIEMVDSPETEGRPALHSSLTPRLKFPARQHDEPSASTERREAQDHNVPYVSPTAKTESVARFMCQELSAISAEKGESAAGTFTSGASIDFGTYPIITGSRERRGCRQPGPERSHSLS